ncbi:DDHD-domain-containing protein [Metschnikowia bicuspidata var. bicuspidata NRRL YB-4993]|uniref:DDHD-domain-containing protein n=1 Tax=Metschnikowia bicuspidata var. bicuspidata NRRL YB-4993 TaxID=869754 RepID=A0A1A0H7P5_9ASCO|nr:DDHD-domain-containing protein [Metschnikowia bicuspidata var. bicuspidata NRRL YB-4993]OBA20046.1 DDHD-domain-containing protein [Metschnikowia bicuspidata var. bicuspidata NRRL YB-4993]
MRLLSTRPVKVKWYYNTDLPLSKPDWYEYTQEKDPEKFMPFSDYDNARLERAYENNQTCVDVREDRLFKVELDKMQLSTVYWTGPVYEVRRGTWFTRDGEPLVQEMALKIEKGYNDVKAYKYKAGEKSQASRELTAKFNSQVKEIPLADAFDIAKEDDVVDLGNGQAVIYFNDVFGALFPKKLSALQVNIIRSMQPSYGSLMSVIPIQRGYTNDLDSSIIDSVKSTNVTSLTDIFQSEVASMFSKDSHLSLSDSGKKPDQSKLLEKVLEADFKNEGSENSSKRDVEHLVLCVHGVGQLLGYKYESVNFTHSVNVMRSTMKEVYKNETKYQELAYGPEFDPKNEKQKANNKIQTLPISWRHRVSFHPRKPGGTDKGTTKGKIPTLSQINVEGVKSLRNIVGDVILDVLLYYEPHYLKQIMSAVLSELNFVYRTYLERNPDFNGKVHLFGHSLGSAICFDLLSQQRKDTNDYKLDFDVENLFCVGSPVGMFEILKQKNIVPRSQVNDTEIQLDASFSSPKCKNIYNIFHPCDPVSYRMEPLVDPKFAEMKADEVPFALKGFNTQVQNLTSISDDIQEKFYLASSWFRRSESDEKLKSDTKKPGVEEENALGDIISTLTSSGQPKASARKTRTDIYDEQELGALLELNRTGRIDYSLPMGVFSIALVSAISAHISYFEDQETMGFVMKEVLSSHLPRAKSRKVTVFS